MKMSSLKKYTALLLVLLVSSLIWAEGSREMETEKVQVSQTRYVFLFIGDGMALTRINAAEAYLKAQQKTSVGVEKLAFSQFPNQGLTTTYDAGSFITDSVPPPELQLRRVTRPFRT